MPSFADDMTLYCSHTSAALACSTVSAALTDTSRALSVRGLWINVSKTVAMVIATHSRTCQGLPTSVQLLLQNEEVQLVSQTRLLGIIIDDSLSWSPHRDSICKKVGCKISALRRMYRQLSHRRSRFGDPNTTSRPTTPKCRFYPICPDKQPKNDLKPAFRFFVFKPVGIQRKTLLSCHVSVFSVFIFFQALVLLWQSSRCICIFVYGSVSAASGAWSSRCGKSLLTCTEDATRSTTHIKLELRLPKCDIDGAGRLTRAKKERKLSSLAIFRVEIGSETPSQVNLSAIISLSGQDVYKQESILENFHKKVSLPYL